MAIAIAMSVLVAAYVMGLLLLLPVHSMPTSLSVSTTMSMSTMANNSSSEKYFALCLIVKATQPYEHYDIREFVDYHLKIGTSVIYMFDDNSPTPFNSTLRDHIDTGAVYYTFIGRYKWYLIKVLCLYFIIYFVVLTPVYLSLL